MRIVSLVRQDGVAAFSLMVLAVVASGRPHVCESATHIPLEKPRLHDGESCHATHTANAGDAKMGARETLQVTRPPGGPDVCLEVHTARASWCPRPEGSQQPWPVKRLHAFTKNTGSRLKSSPGAATTMVTSRRLAGVGHKGMLRSAKAKSPVSLTPNCFVICVHPEHPTRPATRIPYSYSL